LQESIILESVEEYKDGGNNFLKTIKESVNESEQISELDPFDRRVLIE